jgi:parvulin-like peptidyl-prolyl isomerase
LQRWPYSGGDLGWFPRGLLAVPEVEEAAFALQPGETSAVISSALGYHIVQVIERDPARALSPAASQALRAAAYSSWLEARLAEASIQRHINP